MYLFYFSCVLYLINLILYLWNTIESDIIKNWFYIKIQLKLNHTSWGPLHRAEFEYSQAEVNPTRQPPQTSRILQTDENLLFFPLPFFFLILHNWRVWIIYNSQIIFWMVSANGRQRGNFNDVPGSAKPSFTVSQPEKLPAEYHPPSHWSWIDNAAKRLCLQEGTESTSKKSCNHVRVYPHVCFSFDSSIYIKMGKMSRQACLINARF